ncbi:MAG: hypothetical protein AAF376_13470 [Pseudomonadota bacterium]
MTPHHTRIGALSRVLHWFVTLAMIAIPLGILVAFATGAMSEARLRAAYPNVQLPAEITLIGWVTVMLVLTVSLALVLAALWQMRCLFALYTRGEVLGHEAAARILKIGQVLLALAVIGVLGNTLSVLALTFANPEGARSLSVAFSSNDLFLAFAGGLLTVIGWAMVDAARIADENASFV